VASHLNILLTLRLDLTHFYNSWQVLVVIQPE